MLTTIGSINNSTTLVYYMVVFYHNQSLWLSFLGVMIVVAL